MPRTDGIYAVPSGTKGVTLQPIQSGKYNAFLDDLTNDLNASRPVTAGGTGASTADGAAEALGLVSAKDLAGVNTVGGTANAITIVTSRGYDAYAATLYLGFRAASDVAAGGATIDLDGNGTKPLYKTVAAGLVDVNAGDILATGYYWITYDPAANAGGGAFILLNPGNASSAYQVGDFLDSARTLNSDWLRRDGGMYDIDDYPELAALLPALPDGVTWSTLTTGISGSIVAMGIFGSEFFVLTSNGTNTTVWKSTDFATFSNVGTISGMAQASRGEKFGSTYVVVGVNGSNAALVSSSTDAATWSSAIGINSMLGTDVSIAWNGSLYVAVGNNGAISTSPDLVTWTARTSGTSNALYDVRYVNSQFVACGASGTIVTSSNGTSWTVRTSGVTDSLQAAAYGSGLYVIVGGNGRILTSSNLTSWTSRTSGTTQALNAVTYSTSGFVAVGASGTARISGDAITWTASTTSIAGALIDVAFNPAAQNQYFTATSASVHKGIRTLPTQFAVPDDDPAYGWIKAVS